jgi:hypothetical protein
MCHNLDLRFLFYCLFILVFSFLFVLFRLFVFQFLLPFLPFLFGFLLPFLFTFVFVAVFWLLCVSSLAYLDLLGTKMLDCCCLFHI